MTNCNYSEHAKIQRKQIQKQIEELQAKLEELENQKPPIEEAFKRVFGVYPYPCTAWEWFQKGYNAAEEDVRVEEPEQGTWNYDPDAKFRKQEEVKKLQEKEWTYKITDEKGESNPYKQYLNGVKTLRQELFDYGFTEMLSVVTHIMKSASTSTNQYQNPMHLLLGILYKAYENARM